MAVKTKFYNLDTDTTLGGNSASDLYIASQKAVKSYVDGQIPTVNNATLTIKQNSTSKGTFTANASSNVEINLTDTTYSNFVKSGSGAAAGLVPAPSTTAGTSKYLCEDGTWATPAGTSYSGGTGIDITNNVISVTSPTVTNTATESSSYIIGGTNIVSELYRTTLGYGASGGTGGTNIGYDSTGGSYSTTLGYKAKATNSHGIQIGQGTNTEANTMYVGTSSSNNWKMLDNSGLIPDARISSNIARSSDIPAAVTETTVSGWGFTKNTGTVTSVNSVSPVNGNVTLSIPTITDTYSGTSSDGMSGKAVASALGSYVPTTRKVNNKALSADITLSASDVGALPSSTVIPTVTFRAWS